MLIVIILMLVVMAFAFLGIEGQITKLSNKSPSDPPDPCRVSHDFVVIGVRKVPHSEFGDKLMTTLCLKRCKRCSNHVLFPFPGEWELQDFLRLESEGAEFNKIIGAPSK